MKIDGSYYSNVLNRYKNYVAVLPDSINEKTKVLFLLHGVGSDAATWSLNVPLVRFANTYNTAFFCPDAENSFYTDHADGEDYGLAIGQEFYQQMKQIFQMDFSYQNVAIAGFSMGGYGALLLGLRFSEIYSRIGAFSPAFVFYKKERQEAHYQQVFSKGDYESENDCVTVYKNLLQRNKCLPRIEFACGLQDPLCEQTQKVIDQIKSLDPMAQLPFYKQAGFHDFSLWEKDLVRFLENEGKEENENE
ncbi:MAG TPA: hypothetical protein H9829_09210 [Candidatus Tetragenococcus pullicola]|nr:hypothetical protein [Candidatus Tetragenococcus pullicola]